MLLLLVVVVYVDSIVVGGVGGGRGVVASVQSVTLLEVLPGRVPGWEVGGPGVVEGGEEGGVPVGRRGGGRGRGRGTANLFIRTVNYLFLLKFYLRQMSKKGHQLIYLKVFDSSQS